jgi:hypothetical protein
MKKDTLSNVGYRPIARINKIYTQTLLKTKVDETKVDDSGIGIDLDSKRIMLVLSYHLDIEREMVMLLSYYFAYRHNRKEIWELQELVLDELGFEAKRKLMKKLKFFNGDKEVYKKIEYLNFARNAIAHTPTYLIPKMKVYNEKVLTKKVITKIKNDYQELRWKFYAFDWALRDGLDIKHW